MSRRIPAQLLAQPPAPSAFGAQDGYYSELPLVHEVLREAWYRSGLNLCWSTVMEGNLPTNQSVSAALDAAELLDWAVVLQVSEGPSGGLVLSLDPSMGYYVRPAANWSWEVALEVLHALDAQHRLQRELAGRRPILYWDREMLELLEAQRGQPPLLGGRRDRAG